MRIEIVETCKHERDQFVKGEVREVDQAVAAYLLQCGWAVPEGGEARALDRRATVTLDIHKGTIDVKSIFDKVDAAFSKGLKNG